MSPEKQINFQRALRLTYVFALKFFYSRWRAAMGLLERSVAFLDTYICTYSQFFRFSRLLP